MGFFDWVMHGLGFEGKEGKAKEKKSAKTAVQDDKYSNFNLHERVGSNEEVIPTNNAFGSFNVPMQQESNIIMVEPKTIAEIQKVVDYLKQGQSVAVNLEGIASADSNRILDFLSGAIYGLNGSIHRWHGDLFLLTPEGRKILVPEENGGQNEAK